MKVVVIGAGIGGLTAAALLAKRGLSVTVLEAHESPGGCAATFCVDGYRFDVGATVAGGFAPDAPMSLLAHWLGIRWDARPVDPVMTVHLPDGTRVVRFSDSQRWGTERRRAFGDAAEAFWRWQERTADALWAFAMMLPPWRPQSQAELRQLTKLIAKFFAEKPSRALLLADAFRPVATHLAIASPQLRLFVDAQLLISVQCTAERANGLFGAAALDLPRRGVVHFRGGMGTLAQTLADTVVRHSGAVIYNCRAKRIVMEGNKPVAVETANSMSIPADIVVANLTPASVVELLGDKAPRWLRYQTPFPYDGWGAFVVYAGVDASAVPPNFCPHHQIITVEPLAESNSAFLSLSPEWDETRAPHGYRAVTISTHTKLAPWWRLWRTDKAAYEQRKQECTERLLAAADRVIPQFREATTRVLAGTPITFQRYTGRPFGWVGGFPQTSLFRCLPPRIATGIWLVGDSVFPGQSTAAVVLGALRVAQAILREWRLCDGSDFFIQSTTMSRLALQGR